MPEIRNPYFILRGRVKRRTNDFYLFIIRIIFRKIDFDRISIQNLRDYEGKGKIVFVSFQSSNVSMLVFVNLIKRYGFPVPEISFDFLPNILQKISNIWKKLFSWYDYFFRKDDSQITSREYIHRLLNSGGVLLLSLLSKKTFLRRYVDSRSDILQQLILVQQEMDDPIFIFPEIVFWSKRPERSGSLFSINAAGDRTIITGILSMLKISNDPFVRVHEPINLRDEIAKSETKDPQQIAKHVRNLLLDIYSSEKRGVLGPVLKTKQEMREKVLYHRNVIDSIIEVSAEERASEAFMRKKAYRYFNEIAADFSMTHVNFFLWVLDIFFEKIFDGIIYDVSELKKLRDASKNGPLAIAPCHKSHMDYLVASYIFLKNNMMTPHIIAGSNLNFFPIGYLFRKCGAVFMRRSFKRKKIYSAVFRQYIKTLANEGYSIEFFIEGGRTRSGKQLLPKMGVLKYLIEAIEEGYNRDMFIVPLAINYDRILEESSYHNEIKGDKKKKESAAGFMKSGKLLKKKYGKVYLSIGDPVSYNMLKSRFGDSVNLTSEIGMFISQRINSIIEVTPFALVTSALFLFSQKPFSKEMLVEKIAVLYRYFLHAGAKMNPEFVSPEKFNSIASEVTYTYILDGIISEKKPEFSSSERKHGPLYIINDETRSRINIYRNSIVHYLLPPAFASMAILACLKKKEVPYLAAEKVFSAIADIFSLEFVFDESFGDIKSLFRSTVKYFEESGAIKKSSGKIIIKDPGLDELYSFAEMIHDCVEAYLVAGKCIESMEGRHLKKDIVHDVRKTGMKMYQHGEIFLTESLSMPYYLAAISKLTEMGIITSEGADTEIEYLNIEVSEKLESFISSLSLYSKTLRHST